MGPDSLCFVLAVITVTHNNSAMVLGASVMAKIFAGLAGTLTGTIGALIGDAVRRFAKPDMMFTSGGDGISDMDEAVLDDGPSTCWVSHRGTARSKPSSDVGTFP